MFSSSRPFARRGAQQSDIRVCNRNHRAPVFEFRKHRTPRVVAASHADVSAPAENTCLKSCAAVEASAAAMLRQVQMKAAQLRAAAVDQDSLSIASSDAEDLAFKAAAVAEAAKRTAIYARSVAAQHRINPAPPAKSSSVSHFKPPRICLPYKPHRKPSIVGGLPKSARVEEGGDKSVADELLSRAAASKVPVTELAGRFMVPVEIGVRWGNACNFDEMMDILHDKQTLQLAREKDPLIYPADDLVDASMLPLIRPDVSKLTAKNATVRPRPHRASREALQAASK